MILGFPEEYASNFTAVKHLAVPALMVSGKLVTFCGLMVEAEDRISANGFRPCSRCRASARKEFPNGSDWFHARD
jgi:hypothetical protein